MNAEPSTSVLWSKNGERVLLTASGENAIRVTVRRRGDFTDRNSALLHPLPEIPEARADAVSMENGKVRAEIDAQGAIRFVDPRTSEVFFSEPVSLKSPIKLHPPRYMEPTGPNTQKVRMEFAPQEEHIWGMGQHRHGDADHKGTVLDLMMRNGEYAVPFYVSSAGYGFFWNHPGTGTVTFAKNRTLWELEECGQIDYWIVRGDTPKEILSAYVKATGLPPMPPEKMFGYWQCKLRYETQEEVLTVARTFKQKNIPLELLIIDFFHWPEFGDYKLDPKDFPDPQAMVDELREMGVELVVSIWPTVSSFSETIQKVEEEDLMIHNRHGLPMMRSFAKNIADEHVEGGASRIRDYIGFLDFFNPKTRRHVWDRVKENYLSYGIKHFWLDAQEPALNRHDVSQLDYFAGSGAAVGCAYPNQVIDTFADGIAAEEIQDGILLARSGWAGVQRTGAAVWSGDINSTFEEFQKQVTLSLHASMSGLHLWHTDIGGFKLQEMTQDSPDYHELLLRWFQWAAFCPVMRMHGMRSPNEPWSFGEEMEKQLVALIQLRMKLRPYLMEQSKAVAETGIPLVRPLWLEFPEDERCAGVDDQYLLGDRLLVAPVTQPEAREREMVFPAGEQWGCVWGGPTYEGGTRQTVPAPLEQIPVFFRGSEGRPW
jgi:alpha-D-xyloside xylohydrolase